MGDAGLGCYPVNPILDFLIQKDGGTPELIVVAKPVLPAVDGGYGNIPFFTDVCNGKTGTFTAGSKRTHVICMISQYIKDKPKAVSAVWRDQIKQVCMHVIADVAVETINGYPGGIRVMTLIVFRCDQVPFVSDGTPTTACTAAALTHEAVRIKKALRMPYHISLGMIRTDGGFKVVKA